MVGRGRKASVVGEEGETTRVGVEAIGGNERVDGRRKM